MIELETMDRRCVRIAAWLSGLFPPDGLERMQYPDYEKREGQSKIGPPIEIATVEIGPERFRLDVIDRCRVYDLKLIEIDSTATRRSLSRIVETKTLEEMRADAGHIIHRRVVEMLEEFRNARQ